MFSTIFHEAFFIIICLNQNMTSFHFSFLISRCPETNLKKKNDFF